MIDRCGAYYELYRRAAREAGQQAASWSDLRTAAGLDENDLLPDVVQAQPALCGRGVGQISHDGQWALSQFVPKELAEQIVNQIGKDSTDVPRLAQTLEELQTGSEVEIHATEDQVCSKTFDDPLVLPTVTSLSVFTTSLFKGIKEDDDIYISCETGEWLLEDSKLTELLLHQQHIEMITAFDFKFDELRATFGDRLELRSFDPWRHNRHMTIVCRGKSPSRAVYFARRLRTPLITPVYLKNADDAARVERAFDLMRKEIDP